MHRYRRVAIAFVLLGTLAAECAQVDPDPSLLAPVSTTLRVTARDVGGMLVEGVRVLIDGAPSGLTPLTVDVGPGSYAVSVDTTGFVSAPRDSLVSIISGEAADVSFSLAPGFYRTVLVEEFTNSDCQGCPETEALVLALTDGIPFDDVLTLSLHTRIPSPTDPMYGVNALAFTTRAELFYQIPGNPSVAVGGELLPGIPPNEDDIIRAIAIGRSSSTPVRLSVSYSLSGDQIDIDATVQSQEDLQGDLRLVVMTVQDEFTFGTAPGTNGQTHFVRVIRQIVPSANGDPIAITADMDETRSYTTTLLTGATPADDPDRLACVVLLQDWDTKAILQVASTYVSP